MRREELPWALLDVDRALRTGKSRDPACPCHPLAAGLGVTTLKALSQERK